MSKCGTRAGYFTHRRKGEPPCDPCRDAHSLYRREQYQPRGRKKGINLDPARCGTGANYEAHRRRGERACDACKKAHSADTAEWKRNNRKARTAHRKTFNPDKCGTIANYRMHFYYGVPPCEACKNANRQYRRRLYKPRPPQDIPKRAPLSMPSFLSEMYKEDAAWGG